jgi:hypothetical protein
MSSFGTVKLSVPEGLEQILYDLSREILRDQPANIYQYASKYFKDLHAAGTTKPVGRVS